MRILAVNGSPKGTESNTDFLLKPFMEGAQEAGAKAEIVYLAEKIINYCRGCLNCWVTGDCIHKDDMVELLSKFRKSDVIVYATPLYVFSVSGLMKNFMDRSSVIHMKSDIVKREHQFIHPMLHKEDWPKRAVLISNAGYPERHHFNGLL